MIISLINRIIRIPATCKVIMQGEAEENILIKIPKKLLADDEEKNKVFLISQLNDSEQIEEELTCSFVDEYDNNCYYWNLKEEYTLEEGKLEIQIKIERGEGTGPVSLAALNDIENENTEENENESESEEKDPDFEPTPDGEMDPDYLVPYGNNNNGVWYSYKNYFIINKSLISK